MFGSVILDEVTYQRLQSSAVIQSSVGEELYGLTELPQEAKLPAIIYYTEYSNYGNNPVGVDELAHEQLRLVVRVICDDASLDPILEPAQEQLELLSGLKADVTFLGRDYSVEITPAGEFLPTTVREGANFYRQLGTTYNVTVLDNG